MRKEKSYRYIIEGYHPRRSHRKFHGLGYLADNHSSLAKIPNETLGDLYRLQGQPQKNVIRILIPYLEDQWAGDRWEDKYFAYKDRCFECGRDIRKIAHNHYQCTGCGHVTYRDYPGRRRHWFLTTNGNNHCGHVLDHISNWCPPCDGHFPLPEEDSVHEGYEVTCPVLGKRTICRHGRLKRSYYSKDLNIHMSACSICASGGDRTFRGSKKEDKEEEEKLVDAVVQYEEGLLPDPEAISDSASGSETATGLVEGPDPTALDEIYEKPKADAESKVVVDDPEKVEEDERLDEEERREAKLDKSYKRVYPWEMTGVQCRVVCSKGDQCHQPIYGGGPFCFYHTQLMTFVDDKRFPWVKKILENRNSDWVREHKVLIEGENIPRLTLPILKKYLPTEIQGEHKPREYKPPKLIIQALKKHGFWPTGEVVRELTGEELPLHGGRYYDQIFLEFKNCCEREARRRAVGWTNAADEEFHAFKEFICANALLVYAFHYTFVYRPPFHEIILTEMTQLAIDALLDTAREDLGFFITVFKRYFDAVCLAHLIREADDTRDFETVLKESLPIFVRRGNTTFEVWRREPFLRDYVYQRTTHEDHEEIVEHHFGVDAETEQEWEDHDVHAHMVYSTAATGSEKMIFSEHEHYALYQTDPLPETEEEEELVKVCRSAHREQRHSLIWGEKYRPLRAATIKQLGKDLQKDYRYHFAKGRSILSYQFGQVKLRAKREAIVNWHFGNAAKRMAKGGMRDSYKAVPARLEKDLKGQIKNELKNIRKAAYPAWFTRIPKDEKGLPEKVPGPTSLYTKVDKDSGNPRPLEGVLPYPGTEFGDPLWWPQGISNDDFLSCIIPFLVKRFSKVPKRIVAENLFRSTEEIQAILAENGITISRSRIRQIRLEIKRYILNHRAEVIELLWEEQDRYRKRYALFWLELYGAPISVVKGEPLHLTGVCQLIYRKPWVKRDEEWPKPEPLRTIPLTAELISKYQACTDKPIYHQFPYLLVPMGYGDIPGTNGFPYADNEWCEKWSTPNDYCLRCKTATPQTWKAFERFLLGSPTEILPPIMELMSRIRNRRAELRIKE